MLQLQQHRLLVLKVETMPSERHFMLESGLLMKMSGLLVPVGIVLVTAGGDAPGDDDGMQIDSDIIDGDSRPNC